MIVQSFLFVFVRSEKIGRLLSGYLIIVLFFILYIVFMTFLTCWVSLLSSMGHITRFYTPSSHLFSTDKVLGELLTEFTTLFRNFLNVENRPLVLLTLSCKACWNHACLMLSKKPSALYDYGAVLWLDNVLGLITCLNEAKPHLVAFSFFSPALVFPFNFYTKAKLSHWNLQFLVQVFCN